ncbi:MAG: hypothetical protein V1913_07325 [Fibrobacterota bacterium]
MKQWRRYHVYLGKRRTTISISKMLSEVLSLKLKAYPGTREAHMAVSTWLQEQLIKSNDPGRIRTSQWLAGEAILEIADDKLRKAWFDWFNKEFEKEEQRNKKPSKK